MPEGSIKSALLACMHGRICIHICVYYTHTHNVGLFVCVYAGQKLKGKVRNVEDFGAFVDVGAGMRHYAKMTTKQ